MPTITPIIRKSTRKPSKGSDNYSNLRFYISAGRGITPYYKSDILVNFEHWDSKKNCLKAKASINPMERKKVERDIQVTKTNLQTAFDSLIKQGIKPTGKALTDEMNMLLNPTVRTEDTVDFIDLFDDFLRKRGIRGANKEAYDVVKRTFQRYETYKQILDRHFKLDVKTFTADTAMDFDWFIRNEHEISKNYPLLYEKTIEERGGNTLAKYSTRTRAFFSWCVKPRKIIPSSPYDDIEKPNIVLGTPYYLTIEEVNKLYRHDLSARPEMAVQRDIFVFHCVVGCRVSDLNRLRKSNVINGAVEYIAGKTKDNKPKTLRVPLNKIGLAILKKYKDIEGERLLPFITSQKHNVIIKKAFKLAGLDRMVTIMDPKTRFEEQKPLYEVASSHLARRTLYGNVFKSTKSSELAGELTGHAPNSKAASRYRAIDDEMKIEAVEIFEHKKSKKK